MALGPSVGSARMFELIIPLFLFLAASCVFLELCVKSPAVRAVAVLILLTLLCGISAYLGQHIGKTFQLDRFVIMLPRALARLDETRNQPDEFRKTMDLLRSAFNSSDKLDHFESTLNQMEIDKANSSSK